MPCLLTPLTCVTSVVSLKNKRRNVSHDHEVKQNATCLNMYHLIKTEAEEYITSFPGSLILPAPKASEGGGGGWCGR